MYEYMADEQRFREEIAEFRKIPAEDPSIESARYNIQKKANMFLDRVIRFNERLGEEVPYEHIIKLYTLFENMKGVDVSLLNIILRAHEELSRLLPLQPEADDDSDRRLWRAESRRTTAHRSQTNSMVEEGWYPGGFTDAGVPHDVVKKK